MSVKVGLPTSTKNCFICLNEIPLKMMKNGFYFILKAISIFVLYFWSCRKNGLIRKIRLISKYESHRGKQTTAIRILPPNFSRSKCNQTIKFGQLIEYDKRSNFLSKSYRKWDRETSSRPLVQLSGLLKKYVSTGVSM